MKQFKEGQIVKAITDASYVAVGEVAEVQKEKGSEKLCLVFHEGSEFPCHQANPEHFDFYEKVA